jgi:hypothetical protein
MDAMDVKGSDVALPDQFYFLGGIHLGSGRHRAEAADIPFSLSFAPVEH